MEDVLFIAAKGEIEDLVKRYFGQKRQTFDHRVGSNSVNVPVPDAVAWQVKSCECMSLANIARGQPEEPT